MPYDGLETDRMRNYLFTVGLAGGPEHEALVISGQNLMLQEVKYAPSTTKNNYNIPGKIESDSFTVRMVPKKLWEKEGPLASLFELNFDGTPVAHCKRVSGFGVTVTPINNSESTQIVIGKLPGRINFDDVTLEQVSDTKNTNDFYNWIKDFANIGDSQGFQIPVATSKNFQDAKKRVGIRLLARDGSELASWRLIDCTPKDYNPGDLDTGSDNVLIPRCTIKVNGYEEAGVSGDDFGDWVNAAFTCAVPKTVLVRMYDNCAKPGQDAPLRTVKFFGAWPTKVSYVDLVSDATDVFTREIVIANSGLVVQ